MNDTPSPYRIIYFVPQPDGSRERRCLTLAPDRTLLSDEPAPLSSGGITVSPVQAAMTSQEQDLISRGVLFERQANGDLLLTHVPAREQLINQIFLETGPCEFPACEELRGRYWNDVREARSRQPESDCPTFTCTESRLMREYRLLAEEALKT